ncbi:MAG TPA: CopD family protein [Candidatus Thermoplasmatota archaeon]|nr:CopD family protein [Candidatus Thermoplasmatota archaeon]
MRSPGRGGSLLFPLLIVTLLAASATVEAHASLASATPPPNSRVDVAPTELVLTFSEALEDHYTRIEVVDRHGKHYEGATVVDPEVRTRATVPVAPLPDGLYTVRWRTLSVDTHTKSGLYLLGVNANLTGDPMHGHHMSHGMDHEAHLEGQHNHPEEAAARGLSFMALSLAAGIPLFLLAVAQGTGTTLPRSRLLWVASGAALVTALATLLLAALIAGRIETTVLGFFATSSGEAFAWRAGMMLAAGGVLAGLALRDEGSEFIRLPLAALLGLGALAATSASSHAAAATGTTRLLLLTADWLHLVAVAAWVGGVVALLLIVLHRGVDARTAGTLVQRFSPLAVAAVVVIILTGSYGSFQHLGSPADLLTTGYGQALLLKMLVMLPLVALGAINKQVTGPRLATAEGPRHLRRLRAAVGAEVALMAVVLVAAGVLANIAPPGNAPDPAEATGDTAGLPGLVHEFRKDGHHVQVALSPQPVQVGVQTLRILVNPGGEPLPENAAVLAYVYPPSDPNGEGAFVTLTREGDREWAHTGPLLVEEGPWRVRVTLQGKNTYAPSSFTVTVNPTP